MGRGRSNAKFAAAAAGTVFVLGAGGVALFGGSAQHGAATAQSSSRSTAELAALKSAAADGRRPAGITASSSAVETALAWLEQNRRTLGSTSPASLRASRVSQGGASGQTIVRLQESHGGVPVIGGQAVLAVDRGNRVTAAAVKTMQGKAPATAPRVTAAQATKAALAAETKGNARNVHALGTPTLKIFDTRILGGTGLRKPLLTWQVEVEGSGAKPLRRTVYIDANKAYPVASINRLEAALSRRVCDAAGTSAKVPCSGSTPARTEGQAAISGSGAADVNNAYDFAGQTYSFYSGLGRDGIDDSGMRIDSTVRYCPTSSSCPYGNAYWDGNQMVYGAGYASADDVVAHELTHGVTQYTSDLFYWFQSGAINEAMSDIMGELMDQSYSSASGNDTAAVKWKIGEDLPIGSIRDMANPPANGDPDKTSSANYVADTAQTDSGGVHTNSGVANKAAFLMTDGGTFNGQTVTGIGIAKSSRVWYQTEQLLTSGSDYMDLGTTLSQACSSLVGTASISSSDCAQVDKAVVATEMPQTPAKAAVPQAAVCTAPGAVATDLYSNSFDGAPSHTWTGSTLLGANAWQYGSQDTANGGYAKSGKDNLWGDDGAIRSDSVMTMPGTVHVPAGGAFVHFKHAFGFEMNTGNTVGTYDGGVVEYSTDSGSSWHDASSLFAANGYNGSIADGYGTDNPLGGRSAFVGVSMGYQSSRLDLSSLANQNVKFRFRIGTDTGTGDAGWFIDDFRAYTCGSPDTTPPETSIDAGGSGSAPSAGQTVATSSPTFSFSASEYGSTFECRLDGGSWAACSSPVTLSGVADGNHTFEVRASDPAGNQDPTPASRAFSVDTTAPNTSLDSAPPAKIGSGAASFEFSSTEAGATFQCRMDGGSWASCSSPASYSSLVDGGHTFQVRAIDAYGNADATPASSTFLVDTAPPNTSISTASVAWLTTTGRTISFSSSEVPSTFQCSFDDGAWAACTSPVSVSGLAEGPHTIAVRAVDGAGNVDATPATDTFTVDTSGPETFVSSGPALWWPSSSATFDFSSNDPAATFQCAYDSTSVWSACTAPRTWSSLTSGAHSFRVRARDQAGNLDLTPGLVSFTVDRTAPNTSITSAPGSLTRLTKPTFKFTRTPSTDIGTFICRIDTGTWTSCSSPFQPAKALTKGSHTFRVAAVDRAGNTDATPASKTFRVY